MKCGSHELNQIIEISSFRECASVICSIRSMIYLLVCRVRWEVEKRLVLLAEVQMVCFRAIIDANITAFLVYFLLLLSNKHCTSYI